MAKAMIAAMSVSTQNTQDFVPFNSGRGGFYARANIAAHYEDQHKIQLGDGSTEDISWLLPVTRG